MPNKTLEASLLAFDLKKLKPQLLELKKAGVSIIHYDVMDHQFVNNTAFDVEHLQLIHDLGMHSYVHFMVLKPKQWIKRFLHYPLDAITFHPEPISKFQAKQIIKYVKKHHKLVGLAIKPETDCNKYAKLLKLCDLVTIMGVEPGFGGQKFLNTALDNLKKAQAIAKRDNPKLQIQIDGGINLEVIDQIKDYPTNFVSGSFLMNPKQNKKAIVKHVKNL